jgi:hypothetical protein
MFRFHADKFLELTRVLRSISMFFYSHPGDFKDQDREMIGREVVKAQELLKEVGLNHSLKKAYKIGGQTHSKGYDAGHFSRSLDELQDRIKDELEDRFVLCLDSAEAGLYAPDAGALIGEQVVSQFPSLVYEIEESAKCGALGRDTASAFHAIRCLEAAIRAISKCLKIPDPTKGADRSWHNLLKNIDDAIQAKWPHAKDKFQGDGKLFEEFHAALHAMQNPYRNATMHLDAKYSPSEAEVIRIVVKGLLAKVAARMNEDGLPHA